MVGINICHNTRNKNKECQLWFISKILQTDFPCNLKNVFKVLFSLSLEYHSTLKAAIGEQYSRLISDYKILLNKTKFIILFRLLPKYQKYQ